MNTFNSFLLKREATEDLTKTVLSVLGNHAKKELTPDEIASEISVSVQAVRETLKQLRTLPDETNPYVFWGMASNGSGQVTYILNPKFAKTFASK